MTSIATLKKLAPLTLCLALSVTWLGCGDDSSSDDSSTQQQAVDCTDAAQNPYAGTCVETYVADCFDPSGACMGSLDMMTGMTTLVWESGANVETSIAIDPANPTMPGAMTTLTSSGGMACATALSSNNTDGCASKTVYTRASDGAELVFCIQADTSMEITCPDGSSFTVDAQQSQAAEQCQYGGGDAEACTFEQ